MDRTAVSGAAGTGSIPVGGANLQPLATYSTLRVCVSPLEGVAIGTTKCRVTKGVAIGVTKGVAIGKIP